MMISDKSPCQLEYIFFNPLLLFGQRNDLYLSVYHDYYQKSACARTFSPNSSYTCCLLSDLFRESISISQLASLCHLSESHFRKVFRAMTGISPLDYLEHYRIQQACHLLINQSGSLAQIAEMCGYRSFSSFFRQFRQYTGLSPSDWKKKYENHTIPHTFFSLGDKDNNLIFRY